MPSWLLSIDFGTSYTVAVAKVDGRAPEIVEIDGERRVPSVVLVLPSGEIVVGRAADDLSISHPGNALRALKNRLGDTAPVVLDGRPYQVVQLIAALLSEVERQVTQQMGGQPTEVRLTHPAAWNRPRQNRLLEAAAKAGMDNVVLVPEPVAAAVSYAADVGLDADHYIAVYDLGGGTFDCAVLSGGEFSVVGQSAGDQNIGGELFDELLMNRIGGQLDPSVWDAIQVGQQRIWSQVGVSLRNEARKAKEALSSNLYVDVIVPLPSGLVPVRLTRSDFEEIARPHLIETISLMKRCVSEAGIHPSQLSAISLVGGASRSPLVAALVTEAFGDVIISRRGDPKAAVALGAALATRPRVDRQDATDRRITQPASPGTAPQPVRLAPPTMAAPTASHTPLHPPLPAPHLASPHQPASVSTSRTRLVAVVGGCAALIAVAAVAIVVNRDDGNSARGALEAAADLSTATSETEQTDASTTSGPSTSSPVVIGPIATAPTVATTTTLLDSSTAEVADVAVGTVLQTLTGHSSVADSVVFSPDGRTLATGGTDYTAKLWDLATGRVTWNLTAHTASVYSVAFDPTGTRLVTASDDGTARVWDVATGSQLAVLSHDTSATYFSVNTAVFNSNGTLIVTASDDDTARLWDAASGTELHSLNHGSFVSTAEFSPDGSLVVTASLDDTAKIWDASTGELRFTLTGHTQGVETASFNHDGTRIVTASEDNTAKTWDVSTGALIATLFGHVDTVTSATFSPDGSTIVTASEDFTSKVWNVATAELLYSLAHADVVESAIFSPDGTRIVTVGVDYVGHIWNSSDGTLVTELPDVVNDVAYNPDGSTLATPALDGTSSVFIWSATSP